MILDGIRIMLIGLFVVFLVLMFIITAVQLSARLVKRFEKPVSVDEPLGPQDKKSAGVMAAISAAVFRFKKGS